MDLAAYARGSLAWRDILFWRLCPVHSALSPQSLGHIKEKFPPVKGFRTVPHLRSDSHKWAVDSRHINASKEVSIHVVDPSKVVDISSVGKEVLWHVWEEVSINNRSEGECVNHGNCSKRQNLSALEAEQRQKRDLAYPKAQGTVESTG